MKKAIWKSRRNASGGFSVPISEIAEAGYCLHPAHYYGLCPHHHPEQVRAEREKQKREKIKEKIRELKRKMEG